MGNTQTTSQEEWDVKHSLFIKIATDDNLPILDISDRQGYTDYIDFIKEKEATSPVMKGTDLWGRKFLTIKGNVTLTNGEVKPFFQVVFQRYSDSDKLWSGGGHYGQQLVSYQGGISIPQKLFLRDIIISRTIDVSLYPKDDMRLLIADVKTISLDTLSL